MVGACLSLRANQGCEQTWRQPRLAVIDAATVDGRRRLVLIRRDNVEHLLMIGGPTDIVIEQNMVRATAREPALARPAAFAEQLEPAPPFAPPRRQQEPVFQRTEAKQPVPRPVDRLASDQPARELPGAAAEAVFTPAAEAQRLVEALLLRRHQPRTGLTPSPETQPEADAERKYVGAAGLARGGAKLNREGKMASPRPSSVYDSLEQNMANLLGDPTSADGNDYPVHYTRRAR